EGYRIDIHALKSTSMSIGAKELSERCRELENACKNGNYDVIQYNHNSTMTLYNKVLDEIKEYLRIVIKNNQKDEYIKIDDFKSKLILLREYTEQYMIIDAENIVAELINYKYKYQSIEKQIHEIELNLGAFEIDDAIEKIERLLKIKW
ncbi:MAG: Hpt domain-containing protein, partial [Lachnospiraceae bacterium]|nr:Hpt domain-containing protein [Lachnospiraceae bacterium]